MEKISLRVLGVLFIGSLPVLALWFSGIPPKELLGAVATFSEDAASIVQGP